MKFAVLFLLASTSLATADPPQLRGATMEQDVQARIADPKTVELKSDPERRNGSSRRRFVRYESSPWERMWLEGVDQWEREKRICDVITNDHAQMVHDFLNMTCTSRYLPPHDNWCIIDDEFRPLWYNSANRGEFELSWVSPLPLSTVIGKPEPVIPTINHEHIVSKFTFLDETTGKEYVEYIEPLMSHLRFPLTLCIDPVPNKPEFEYHYTEFRGFLIPPPPQAVLTFNKAIYFDAGASSWGDGSGGPSLKYFNNMWARSGINIDEIYAFEVKTTEYKFYESIPLYYRSKVHYQQCAVSSSANDDSDANPFLPNMIKRKASDQDYVLFKLDIDSPRVENGNIDFILADEDNHIDELVWEHHIAGNYLMKVWGPPEHQDQLSMRESYEYFLKMRNKGIRAHSWV